MSLNKAKIDRLTAAAVHAAVKQERLKNFHMMAIWLTGAADQLALKGEGQAAEFTHSLAQIPGKLLAAIEHEESIKHKGSTQEDDPISWDGNAKIQPDAVIGPSQPGIAPAPAPTATTDAPFDLAPKAVECGSIFLANPSVELPQGEAKQSEAHSGASVSQFVESLSA